MIAKATYDPELEKQLTVEREQAREAKKKYREGLQQLRTVLANQIKNTMISPEGATLVKALIQDAEKWIKDNPDATSDEIQDKSADYFNQVVQIYEDDKGRIYHIFFTTLWKNWIDFWKSTNIISEDTAKKCMKIIDDEVLWYKKHTNESNETYAQRILDMVEALKKELPADLEGDIRKKMENKPSTQDDIDKMKAQAKQEKEDREALEKKNFDTKRIVKKATAGVSSAIFWSVLISFAIFGASIASNMAVIRPVPIRVLCWFYGLIFFIPVILYAAIQYIMGKKPYFAAYLIPLYMYDPMTTEKKSFLEKLVWYKDNPIIHDAQSTFQQAAQAALG